MAFTFTTNDLPQMPTFVDRSRFTRPSYDFDVYGEVTLNLGAFLDLEDPDDEDVFEKLCGSVWLYGAEYLDIDPEVAAWHAAATSTTQQHDDGDDEGDDRSDLTSYVVSTFTTPSQVAAGIQRWQLDVANLADFDEEGDLPSESGMRAQFPPESGSPEVYQMGDADDPDLPEDEQIGFLYDICNWAEPPLTGLGTAPGSHTNSATLNAGASLQSNCIEVYVTSEGRLVPAGSHHCSEDEEPSLQRQQQQHYQQQRHPKVPALPAGWTWFFFGGAGGVITREDCADECLWSAIDPPFTTGSGGGPGTR